MPAGLRPAFAPDEDRNTRLRQAGIEGRELRPAFAPDEDRNFSHRLVSSPSMVTVLRPAFAPDEDRNCPRCPAAR